ncbi:MAG: MFS transporter [Candidatus Muproteobacteria bacterium RBG_16_64_10]|uniref:MFS transporter n=1 Tax=Candidatus Muproteobacteria bacterium RBG_16_64_10 TaxID=1817757 RepID=A0A1F6SYH3_9PROT|nr:MAG: MFS transporter [Candidatus Muproteobacteria bacterium RBG_16_64_10]
MNSLERRAVGLLASIYALRMAGLFLILPVFALYAQNLTGHTPLLIGIAIGAYGLTQAILQIPFGMLSDHLGRKPVIAAGLLIFAVGRVIAASADSIWMVIAGRAMQGAGAIAAAIMAMVSDLTREEQRTKAMAIVGMTIGASFVLSLILGPVLDGVIGVPGIFWLTGILAVLAIGVTLFLVPTPVRVERDRSRNLREEFARILRDAQLLRLDAGIFVLHLVMTAMFVVLPGVIVQHLGLAAPAHWELYLPVMLAGFAAMLPFLIYANRKRVTRRVLTGAVAVLILAQLVFFFGHTTHVGLIAGLWLFFASFSLLEAMLPSLVSRLAPGESKGAAIGVYSSTQFLGAFAGGALGGYLSGVYGASGVFVLAAAVLGAWLLLILGMHEPRFLVTREIRIQARTPAQAEKIAKRLAAVPGVAEAIVIAEEGIAYLKVDTHALDERALREVSAAV